MQLVENEKNISNTNPNDLLNENKMLKDEITRQKIQLKNEALQQELNADHMIDNLENSLKSNDNERKNFQLLVCKLTEALFDARKDKYDFQDECDEKNQLLNAMTEEMNSLKINFAEKSSKMQKFIRHHKNRCDKDFENLLTVTRKWKTKYFHLRNELQQLQENGNVETHQLNEKVQYLENCVWNLSGQLQESDYNLNLLHQSSQDRENSLVTKLMDARIQFQNFVNKSPIDKENSKFLHATYGLAIKKEETSRRAKKNENMKVELLQGKFLEKLNRNYEELQNEIEKLKKYIINHKRDKKVM
ncbi:unnamed protein product [Meganyctiphanes norvegica]|uniref:Uncharacterized protein n=1 Tax=Meganyctiphanes norvegica TaxID=48144 RepID=A0AAV2PZP9_MEGNR